MDTDAVTMNAARGFAGGLLARRAAHIAKDELICGEGYGFAYGGGREALGQGCGGGFGGLFRRGFENGLTELIHPIVFGGAVANGTVEQLVFFEDLWQKLRGLVVFFRVLPRLGLHAVTDRLAQKRESVLFANEIEEVPGAIGQYHAMDL